jgi:N-carbamoyl-L-amino-acid hydrolase
MPTIPETLRVDPGRLWEDFQNLSRFGRTQEEGVSRPAFSAVHLQARAWFRERVLAAGLKFSVDGAGNHSARLDCALPAAGKHARVLLLGSHLDSVPNGGRYDGALGVLAALEVLRVIKDAGLALPVDLEAIDFSDEEGTLLGLMGSRALAGKLTRAELAAPRGGRQALLEGLGRAGLDEAGLLTANRSVQQVSGYLELHIEQGPRLKSQGMQIGVVTAIVGISSYRLVFTGRADHAGTTPVQDRLDAAQGAAAFILEARKLVLQQFPGCVANVGLLVLEPGAYNIVPQRAVLGFECRSASMGELERLEAALLAQAQHEAQRYNLGLEAELLSRHAPAMMSVKVQDAIAGAAEALGLAHTRLASGAGHDAQSLASLCSSGMIFIPSQEGGSHSPREHSTWQDCLNGANVLLGATLRMALQQMDQTI